MWLALDIGNSAAKGGLYDGSAPESVFHLDWTDSPLRQDPSPETWTRQLQAKIDGTAVHRAGIASVVPSLTGGARAALASLTGTAPTLVGPSLRLPFELAYETPETLGADRLAAAAAAWEQFGTTDDGAQRPVVAIDAGTAINYEVITPPGRYRGGAIAPGPALLRRALHGGTAQLPDVPLRFPSSVIGASTQMALQAGIMSALVDSVAGMIARIKDELQHDPAIVVTGGWRTLLNDHLDAIDYVAPHLVLDGIRLLMALNPPEDEP